VRTALARDRLGLEVEVVQPVEVAAQLGVVGGPDLLEVADELLGAPVALAVLEPGLS
jgi:hypothetical protein